MNHGLLLQFLDELGVRKIINKMFASYSTNRRIRVKGQDVLSDPFIVKDGLQQGSILGPLLYLIY